MTVFSVLHGPLSVSVLILTLFFTRTQLEAWSSFLTVSTIVMLISCALAILMVGIPYVSNLSIDKIFNRQSTWQLLWYHAVVVTTVLFNTGSLVSLYLYAEVMTA
jgi:hypothetical protein